MGNDSSRVENNLDHRFNILSYEQFLIDDKVKNYDKICMTEIMNADMMIATFGEKQYNSSCTEILNMGNDAYKQMGIDHLIKVYVHTYKTFIAVANADMSDDDFYKLMKSNHDQYELITARQTGLGGVSRFVLAFGGDLIDRAKSAYYVNRNLPTNFLVAQNERAQLVAENESHFEIFDLLNYAISNNKVVPFYQGIRCNEMQKITKYEALMRIYDKNGKIYPPGAFMYAAKKLKLYLSLSKIIIDSSLKDFEGKQSEVGLNISLLDIQSPEFKEWILNRLKQHPNPGQVIIEFVETENYNNNTELFEFLKAVRDIGCKIAVDDFGVGFATYSSIVSLKPDIIKIDGDIIKKLADSEDDRIILKSIKYMADLVNAKTTAEFVENAEIQAVLEEHKIDYSQGYYYAKPEPKENLNIE